MPPKPVTPIRRNGPPASEAISTATSTGSQPRMVAAPELKQRGPTTKVQAARTPSQSQSQAVSKAKAKARKVNPRKRTWLALLVNSGFIYILIAHYFLCPPSDPNSSHAPVCNAIDRVSSFRSHVISSLEPHARPYITSAQGHIEPYVAPVRPYYTAASSRAAPIVSHAKKQAHGLLQHAHKRSGPALKEGRKQWDKHAGPRLAQAQKHTDQLRKQHVDPFLDFGRQRIDIARTRLRPYQKHAEATYARTAPHVVKFYQTRARPVALKTWEHTAHHWGTTVRPALGAGAATTWEGIRTRVWPMVIRFWSIYVQPQVERIRDRVYQYKQGSEGRKAVKVGEREMDRAVREGTGGEEGLGDVEDFIKSLRKEMEAERKAEEKARAKGDIHRHDREPSQKTEEEIKESIKKKRSSLVAAQNAYQASITRLGESQRAVLIEKLASLRENTPTDLGHRFDALPASLERSSNNMIDKLESYLTKLVKEEKEDQSGTGDKERAEDALALVEKVAGKVYDKADEAYKEIEEYGKLYEARELDAAAVAYEPLRQLGSVKEGELSHGWAWLEDVTVKDWSRFHADKNANRALLASFQALCTSSPPYRSTPHLPSNPVPALLKKVEKQVDAVLARLESRIDSVRNAGPRGVQDSVVSRARSELSVRASRAAEAAKNIQVPFNLPGVLPRDPEPVGVADRVIQAYREAGHSAGQFVGNLPDTVKSAIGAAPTKAGIAERVQNAANEAYRGAQSAVGIEPEPTDAAGHVNSVINQASKSGASLAAEASKSAAAAYANVPDVGKAAQDAYRGAQQAVGIEPEPTDVAGHVASAYRQATASGASLAAEASKSAAAAYGSVPDVGKVAQDALRGAQSAVGIEPEPTDVAGRVASAARQASRSGSSLAAEASKSAASAYANAPDAGKAAQNAYRSAQSAVGIEPEPTDVAGRVASAARQASRSASSLAAEASKSAASAYANAPDAGKAANDAYRSAQSAVGIEPEPTDAAGRIASAMRQLSKSASSVAMAGTDAAAAGYAQVTDGASSAYDSLPTPSKVAHDGYRAAQRAAGVQPSAEGVAESVRSAYTAAASAAGSYLSDFPSGADATQAAYRAGQRVIGQDPEPATAGDYVELAQKKVRQNAEAAADSAKSAYGAAKKAVGLEEEPETVGEKVGKAYEEAKDSVAEALEAAKEAMARLGREEL